MKISKTNLKSDFLVEKNNMDVIYYNGYYIKGLYIAKRK